METRLAILGGGPAGYSAGLKAADAGVKPVIVERDRIGGTCLHVGCIPTKTLLAGAEAWTLARRGPAFGLELPAPPRVALAGLLERKRQVVRLLEQALAQRLAAKGVVILAGEGTLAAPDTIAVRLAGGGTESVSAEHVVVATGSAPKLLPGLARAPGRVLTSDDLLAAESWPASLVVVGGGVVGVEFASLLASAGTRVTILEALPGLLPGEDAEVGRRLAQAFAAAGITVRTGSALAGLDVTAGGVVARPAAGEPVTAEAALIAVGRRPILAGVDAAALGLREARGGLPVDAGQRTNLAGVLAAGDVTGGMQLAHLAAAQGTRAAASALGLPDDTDLATVPRCVYALPETASVGMTEEQLKAGGAPYRKGKSLLRGNARAQTLGEGDGFVKVLASAEDGTILGVHAVGRGVSELIAEAALAVSLKLTTARVRGVIHAHPTLSEAFREACEGA